MLVSVIIPTRNRRSLLGRTLDSVLRQAAVDLDVIVVDEASTDGTREFLAAVGDPRLRVVRHDQPHGLPQARNSGADAARGDWLAFIDDDDLWAPDRIRLQMDAADRASRDWVYTGAVNLEDDRIVFGRPPAPPDVVVAALPRYNAIPGGGSNVVMRRSLWLRAGPFETRFRRGGEDWEMSIRLARLAPPAWVCRPLVAKRVHAANMSLDVHEITAAARLVEELHHRPVDWGRVHRWLAERYLRRGRRAAALGQLARAALRGQPAGAAADLFEVLRRRLGRARHDSGPEPVDAWHTEAVAWLRVFEPTVH